MDNYSHGQKECPVIYLHKPVVYHILFYICKQSGKLCLRRKTGKQYGAVRCQKSHCAIHIRSHAADVILSARCAGKPILPPGDQVGLHHKFIILVLLYGSLNFPFHGNFIKVGDQDISAKKKYDTEKYHNGNYDLCA